MVIRDVIMLRGLYSHDARTQSELDKVYGDERRTRLYIRVMILGVYQLLL